MIKAQYQNYDGHLAERTLAPYSLICKSSVWYLLAERDGELRTYRINRFHSLHLLDESFTRRPDFDLPAYWRAHLQNLDSFSSGYRCTLRVHPDRIAFVKTLMPGRWEMDADAEDTEWKIITLSMDSDLQAKMLVFGLSGFIEILEPSELKKAVAAQARDVLEQLAL
jgi:predicted DNA-binding transcriptional regulator YafY